MGPCIFQTCSFVACLFDDGHPAHCIARDSLSNRAVILIGAPGRELSLLIRLIDLVNGTDRAGAEVRNG